MPENTLETNPANYTKVDKAMKEIGFKAKYNIDDMARDAWNWQKKKQQRFKIK